MHITEIRIEAVDDLARQYVALAERYDDARNAAIQMLVTATLAPLLHWVPGYAECMASEGEELEDPWTAEAVWARASRIPGYEEAAQRARALAEETTGTARQLTRALGWDFNTCRRALKAFRDETEGYAQGEGFCAMCKRVGLSIPTGSTLDGERSADKPVRR